MGLGSRPWRTATVTIAQSRNTRATKKKICAMKKRSPMISVLFSGASSWSFRSAPILTRQPGISLETTRRIAFSCREASILQARRYYQAACIANSLAIR